jgi:prepilin-type N-terminal cleavage/methylation domain-containing protein
MRRGFTILEVLVASSILAIGSLGVLGMLITTIENNRASRLRTDAIILAEQQLADLEFYGTFKPQDMIKNGQAKDVFLMEISEASFNVWVPWKSVNAQGIESSDSSENIYTIGYFKLPGNQVAPEDDFLRGAIRITWSQRSDKDCSGKNIFEDLDRESTRRDINYCDFITVPFAYMNAQLNSE